MSGRSEVLLLIGSKEYRLRKVTIPPSGFLVADVHGKISGPAIPAERRMILRQEGRLVWLRGHGESTAKGDGNQFI